MSSDDRNEGVSLAAQAFIAGALEADVSMQVRHAIKRGSMAGRCGSFDGQTVRDASAVNCDACKALASKRGQR